MFAILDRVLGEILQSKNSSNNYFFLRHFLGSLIGLFSPWPSQSFAFIGWTGCTS
jgi:hypothetical protein